MGSLRTFQVCAKTDCTRFDGWGARAALKTKAPSTSTRWPASGLDSTALDSIANTFDSVSTQSTRPLWRESDIDSNTVVLVLMTNTVNKL